MLRININIIYKIAVIVSDLHVEQKAYAQYIMCTHLHTHTHTHMYTHTHTHTHMHTHAHTKSVSGSIIKHPKTTEIRKNNVKRISKSLILVLLSMF